MKPKYIQIADELEDRILDGVYKPADALPTFNELARTYSVSVVTVNQAIKELDKRGRIIRKRGKAVYISELDDRRKKTHNIGFIVPDIADPYFAALAKIIERDLISHKYALITHSTDGDGVWMNRCIRHLLDRKVDGILLIPLELSGPEQEEILWKLKVERVPFVYLGDQFARVPADCVIVDRKQGVRALLDHLIDLGHREFACISAVPQVVATEAKIHTFREHLGSHNIKVDEGNIIISEKYRDEGGYQAGLKLFKREKRPTAVFATNDFIAIGVIRAAKHLGLKIPEDVSVVGYNDIELARIFEPNLTTIAQPVEELADLATRILFGRINNTLPVDFQRHVLIPRLVVRESASAFSEDHNSIAKTTA